MSVTGLPLIDMLRTRMQWHQSRQKVLAENVANADTPGFQPRDLAAPRPAPGGGGTAGAAPAFGMERTSPLHLAQGGGADRADARAAQRFEVTPSGNAVSLEDEMMKVAQNQSDYQMAASLYSKSMQMLRTAIGRR